MPRAPPPSGQLQFQGRRDWPIEAEPDDWGLTPQHQETYVEQFRRILAAKKAWREDKHDFWTLRRFLRARSYDLEKATAMWLNTLKFRQEFGVDTILQDFYFGEREKFLVCFPQGYHKTDKMGRPVYIQLLGQVNVGEIKKTTTEERMLKFHIQEYERCCKVILPVCSQLAQRNIDTTFGIMDVRGVGLSHMTGEVRRLLSLITKYDQDNYPEMLGHICIINAPSMFRMAWSVVKGMLDPRTQSKIEILGTDYLQPLLKWVDAESLPDWLGGKSHGSLLDDVGPWSDPDTIARLGVDIEQLRQGNKPQGNVLSSVPSGRRQGSGSLEQQPSFQRRSENQSDAYQSPEGSSSDLSGYRSNPSMRHPSVQLDPQDGKQGNASTPRLSGGDRHIPGPMQTFAAIPEQGSGGGARNGTLVQRVAHLESTLAMFKAPAGGEGNGHGGGMAAMNGHGMGGASTRSAPAGSLLYRVEMLEEALLTLTAAHQVTLQNQQQLLEEQKSRQHQNSKDKSVCCCSVM